MNFHKRIRKKLQIIIGKTPLEFGTLDYWIYTVGISLLLQLYFHKHARFWKNSTKKKKSSFFGVLVHVFMSHFTEKGGKKQKKVQREWEMKATWNSLGYYGETEWQLQKRNCYPYLVKVHYFNAHYTFTWN